MKLSTNFVKDYVDIDVDAELSDTSENPVQNKVIKSYIDNAVQNVEIDVDDALSGESKSGGGESSSARKKAFELEDLTKNIPFIPSVIYVVITLILIIVGYKRKKSNFT